MVVVLASGPVDVAQYGHSLADHVKVDRKEDAVTASDELYESHDVRIGTPAGSGMRNDRFHRTDDVLCVKENEHTIGTAIDCMVQDARHHGDHAADCGYLPLIGVQEHDSIVLEMDPEFLIRSVESYLEIAPALILEALLEVPLVAPVVDKMPLDGHQLDQCLVSILLGGHANAAQI